MKPRFIALTALIVAAIFLSSPVSGQSEDRAVALFKEAETLRIQGKSKDDLLTAIKKYEESLVLFQKRSDRKSEGTLLNSLGLTYDDLGQSQKALEYYEKALAIRRTTDDTNGLAITLSNVGAVYDKIGQHQKALQYYEESLKLRRKAGDVSGEGITLGNIGLSYDNIGQYQKALEYYEKSLAIKRRTSDQKGEGIILNNIGATLRNLGQYQKALENYEKSLELRRKTQDIRGEGATLNNMGLVCDNLGQYQKALKYYEESLEIRRKTGDAPGEGITLSNIGAVYDNMGQWQKALEYYEKSLVLMRKLGNVRSESLTLSNIGLVYDNTGQYQKALQYYEQSLATKRKIGDTRGEGVTLNNMGATFRNMGQYPKALEYYDKSLAIRRKIGDIHGESVTLSNMGLVCDNMGQFQKALDYYDKALAIKQKIGDPQGEGITLCNFGAVYDNQGQYQKALEYYEQALAIMRRIGDLKAEAITLSNMGLIFDNTGQYQKALEYYEKSVEMKRKVGDIKGEGVTFNNIGATYRNLGQYQKALEYYEKSLEIRSKTGDLQGEGVTLSNIGLAYENLGQHQKALEYCEKALAIRRKVGDVQGESVTLSNIGSTYDTQGQYVKALDYYQQSIAIGKRIGIPVQGTENAIAHLHMETGELEKAQTILAKSGYFSTWGRFYLLKSEFDKARQNYEKSFQRAEQIRNAQELFVSLTGLARAFEGLEDYHKAQEFYSKGVALVEEMRSALNPSQRVNFYEVKISGFYRSDPAHGLTRVNMKLNRSADSIASSEVTRARAFADNISGRSSGGYSKVPMNIVKQEEELVQKIAGLRQSRDKMDPGKRSEAYENTTKDIERAERQLAEFVDMLWKDYEAYAAVKYPRPVRLKEAAVRPDEHILVFDVVGEGVGVKLVKGKELITTFYVKWDVKDLELQVQKFREPFEKFELRGFDPELARMLFKRLVARAVLEIPEGTPITIIPDGVLAALPFEALVTEGKVQWKEGPKGDYPDGLKFLGDSHPINYYQSITALHLARTLGKKTLPGNKMLVMADPVFETDDPRLATTAAAKERSVMSGLPIKLMSAQKEIGLTFNRLPLTGDLARSLKQTYSDNAELFTGMEAQKEVLFKKHLTDYRYIIFATHGYFGTDFPGLREPILAFTLVDHAKEDEGFLRMTEVTALTLNADVVALTACQTGLGRHIRGEGTMGMGRAFQYAGAKTVLMSLWSVAESSSVKLVEGFFRNLKEGKSKMQALNMARHEIRQAGFEHPFFWAPFILVGETE